MAKKPEILEAKYRDKSSLKLVSNKHIAKHAIQIQKVRREFVIVVGTEVHYLQRTNHMMFFGAATNALNDTKDQYDLYTIYYFNAGYNNAELSAVRASLATISTKLNRKISLVKVTSTVDLIKHLNKLNIKNITTGKIYQKKIALMHIYSHGLPSRITFDLDGPTDKTAEFWEKDLRQLKQGIFTKNGKLISYACRTGMTHSKKHNNQNRDSFTSDEQAMLQLSLAQKMAEHFNIKVYAFIRRSNYALVWNGSTQKYKEGFIDILHPGLVNEHFRDCKSWSPLRNAKCAWQHGVGNYSDFALWNINGGSAYPVGAALPTGLSKDLVLFQSKQLQKEEAEDKAKAHIKRGNELPVKIGEPGTDLIN